MTTPRRFTAELQLARRRQSGGLPADDGAQTAVAPSLADELLQALAALDGKVDHLRQELASAAGRWTDALPPPGDRDTDDADPAAATPAAADAPCAAAPQAAAAERDTLAARLDCLRAEVAAIRHPHVHDDSLRQAAAEVRAVTAGTESAAVLIMAAAELLQGHLQALRGQTRGRPDPTRIGAMEQAVVQIYEACNFQDLTGQRLAKVLRALDFVEARVTAMAAQWPTDDLAQMPLPPDLAPMDDGLAMHGPAEQGVSGNVSGNLSQADIDALFD